MDSIFFACLKILFIKEGRINAVTSNDSTNISQELGMLNMPVQKWTNLYDLRTGLKAGTIFPALNKPFYAGGGTNGR
ncbi:MAG: spore coat associated protein CotJA [Oscillospiraceae bacterium]|jgi:hypothetical protein|nr:spore coat associated protein CotJA [Oscillospiraceae bacterium]